MERIIPPSLYVLSSLFFVFAVWVTPDILPYVNFSISPVLSLLFALIIIIPVLIGINLLRKKRWAWVWSIVLGILLTIASGFPSLMYLIDPNRSSIVTGVEDINYIFVAFVMGLLAIYLALSKSVSVLFKKSK